MEDRKNRYIEALNSCIKAWKDNNNCDFFGDYDIKCKECIQPYILLNSINDEVINKNVFKYYAIPNGLQIKFKRLKLSKWEKILGYLDKKTKSLENSL